MSWSLWLEADLGAGMINVSETSVGYTYNVSPMIVEATGLPARDWNGKSATEMAETARRLIEQLESFPEKYDAMNPPNGYGNRKGLLSTMKRVLEQCERAPNATVYMSL